MTEPLLTLKQTAALLGVNEATLRTMVRTGDGPPAFRVGPRFIKFDRGELTAWLGQRRVTPDQSARA